MSYQFYSKERSAEDIIVEIAQIELELSNLREQALNEDAAKERVDKLKDKRKGRFAKFEDDVGNFIKNKK